MQSTSLDGELTVREALLGTFSAQYPDPLPDD